MGLGQVPLSGGGHGFRVMARASFKHVRVRVRFAFCSFVKLGLGLGLERDVFPQANPQFINTQRVHTNHIISGM